MNKKYFFNSVIFLIIIFNLLVADNESEFNNFFNNAKEKFSLGDYAAAESNIKQALLLNPTSETAIKFYLDLMKAGVTDKNQSADTTGGVAQKVENVVSKEEKNNASSNLMSQLNTILKDENVKFIPAGKTDEQLELEKNIVNQKLLRKTNYVDKDKTNNNIYEIRFIPSETKSSIIIKGDEYFDFLPHKNLKPTMLIIDIPNAIDSLPPQKLKINSGQVKSIRHQQFKSFPVPTIRIIIDLKDWSKNYSIKNLSNNEILINIANKDGVDLGAEASKKKSELKFGAQQFEGIKTGEFVKDKSGFFQKYIKILSDKSIVKKADEELEIPVIVQIVDTANKYYPLSPVEFKIDNNRTLIVSDKDGIVELRNFTFPTKVGIYKMEITLLETGYKNFIDVKINCGAPDKIIKINGDNQKAYLNKEIEKPFVIKVTDKYGNAVQNGKVYFSISKGEGVLDVNPNNDIENEVVATTDSEGIAKCQYFKIGLEKGFNVVKASILVDEIIDNAKSLIMTTSTNLSGAMSDLINYIKEPSSDIKLVIIETKEKVDFKKLKADIFSELTTAGNITEFPQFKSLFVSDEATNLSRIYDVLENYQGYEVATKTLRSVDFTVEALPRLISIDFVNANLADVLRTLAELGNWNISYPELEAATPVNVHLVDVSALMALDIILENQGFARVQEGNVIKIIPKEEAKSRGTTTNTGYNYQDLPEGNAYITQVIPLKYANGDEISKALEPFRSNDGVITFEKSSNSLVVSDNTLNIKRFLKIINEFDKIAKESSLGQTPYLKIYSLKYEKPSLIKQKLDELLQNLVTKQTSGKVQITEEADKAKDTKKKKKKATKEGEEAPAKKAANEAEISFENIEELAIVAHDEKGLLIVYANEGNHKNIEAIIKVVDNPAEAKLKVFDKTKDLGGQDPIVLKNVLMELKSAAANQTQSGIYVPVGGLYTQELVEEGASVVSTRKTSWLKQQERDPRKYSMVATADKLCIIGDPAALKEFTAIIEEIVKENIELTALKEALNELRIYKLDNIKAMDAQNYLQSIEKVSMAFIKTIIDENNKENLYIITSPDIHNKIERIIKKIDIKELSNLALYSMVMVLDKEKDLKGNDPKIIAGIIYDMKTLKENYDEKGDFIPYGGIKEIESKSSWNELWTQSRTTQREIIKDPRKYTLIPSSDRLAIVAEPDILRDISGLILDLINANIDMDKLRSPINELEIYDLNYIDPDDFVTYLQNVENINFPYSKSVNVDNKKRLYIIGDEGAHLKIKRIKNAIDKEALKGINIYTNVRVFDRVNDLKFNNPERLREIILTMPNLNANKGTDGKYIEPNAKEKQFDDNDNLIGERLIDPRQYIIISSNDQFVLIAPPEPMREITKVVLDIVNSNVDLEQLKTPLREFQRIIFKNISGIQAINYFTKIENKIFDYIKDSSDSNSQAVTLICSKEQILDIDRIVKKIDTPEFAKIDFFNDLEVAVIKFFNANVKNLQNIFEKGTVGKPTAIGSLLSAKGNIFIDYENNAIIVNDYHVNIDRIKDVAKIYDVSNDIRIEIVQLKNIEVNTLKGQENTDGILGKLLTDKGKIILSTPSNSIIIQDMQFVIDKLKPVLLKLDENAVDKNNWIVSKTFYLKYAKAASGTGGGVFTETIEPIDVRLKDLVTDDIKAINEVTSKMFGVVTADARTNSVTVISTQKFMQRIEEIINALDLPPRQVLIEAKIIERTVSNNEAFGINWAQGFNKGISPTISAAISEKKDGIGVQFAPGTLNAPFVATLSSGQFRAMLEAMERSQSADVLSRPNVFTMDNIPARISVIQKVPYQEMSYIQGAAGNIPQAVQKSVDVPVELNILPQIGLNRTIQLSIKIDVQKAEPAPTGQMPPVSARQLNTRVLVADGQTVILGGIFLDNEQKDNSSLPGTKSLQKIPLIGNLFGKKSSDRSHTELLIFVTPKIIESPVEATQLKEEFVKKYGEISTPELNVNIAALSQIADYYLTIIMPEIQNKIIEKNKASETGFKIKKYLPEWVEDEAFAIALANGIIEFKEVFKIPFISADDLERIIIRYKNEVKPITQYENLYEELSKKAEISVNINTIRVDELARVPGLNYNIAQQIIKIRNEIKYFKELNEVKEILVKSGVSETYYDNYLKKIFTIGVENRMFNFSSVSLAENKEVQKNSGSRNIVQLNLNSVNAEDLRNIPELNEIESQMIIAYRNRYGKFRSIDDLKNVPDIENKFDRIKNYFTVSDN